MPPPNAHVNTRDAGMWHASAGSVKSTQNAGHNAPIGRTAVDWGAGAPLRSGSLIVLNLRRISIAPMDRLKVALERLDVAIDHLDAAFEHQKARAVAERDELARALAAAQAAEAEARAVADTVSARLDTAIDRLQTVLED
jgi:hypothetical protein